MYRDRDHGHAITWFLFEDAEMHELEPDIPPDRAKIKEPLYKIAFNVSDHPPRMNKMGPLNVTTRRTAILRIYCKTSSSTCTVVTSKEAHQNDQMDHGFNMDNVHCREPTNMPDKFLKPAGI